MTGAASGVPVTFADGVKGEIAELISATGAPDESHTYLEALKRRIAELFLECQGNPYAGERMGPGRHPELRDCRRVRFDVDGHRGKPRLRLIYRNEPSDGAPAECRWLAVGPRAGLRAHRSAQRRLRSD
jgi:hypothetical protein